MLWRFLCFLRGHDLAVDFHFAIAGKFDLYFVGEGLADSGQGHAIIGLAKIGIFLSDGFCLCIMANPTTHPVESAGDGDVGFDAFVLRGDELDIIHLFYQFCFFILQAKQLPFEESTVAFGHFQLLVGFLDILIQAGNLGLERAFFLVQSVVLGFQLGNRFLSLLDDRIRLGLQRCEGILLFFQ